MYKKKVLLLHPSSDLYGSSKVALQVAKLMIKVGCQVHVILPYEGPLTDAMREEGAVVSHHNLAVLRRKYLNFQGILNRLCRFSSAYNKLSEYVRKNRIDLIYTNTSVIWVGAILAKRKGIEHITHLHEMPSGNTIYVKVASSILKNSTKLIAVSDGVKNFWSDRMKQATIVRIYNGFDFKFGTKQLFKNGNWLIASIGRIHPLKGHEYLIEIARKLVDRGLKVEFWIAGSPYKGYEEYLDRLLSRVKSENLEGIVKFLGERPDIGDILKTADLLIHPSQYPDSLPTTIIEALYMKVPVVATDILGANEFLENEKNGILIPLNDPEDASNTIMRLLDNKELRNKLSEGGKELFERQFTLREFESHLLSEVNFVA